MLNGRNHLPPQTGVAVSGRGTSVQADADASALYGEYEQRLAAELADLLRTGAAPRYASTGAPDQKAIGAQPEIGGSAARRSARRSGMMPAAVPPNDFAGDDDDPPLPFSWRHESRPPEASWLARQLKAGLMGLGAGLIVVLPALAVFSGRFDQWLPVTKPALPTIEATAVETRTPTALMVTAAAEETSAEQPVRPATVELTPKVHEVAEPAPVTATREPIGVQVRSVVTVGAFPPAIAPLAPTETARLPERAEPLPALPPSRTDVAVRTIEVPPPPPVVSPVDEAAGLLAAGQQLVKAGDVMGARTPLARAANLGNAEAMLALGETFDPNMLAAWAVRDVKSDVSSARLFYTRAVAAGLGRARARLDALN